MTNSIQQESKVLEDNDLDFTQELHRIRAHLLHYASLLEDFNKTVNFVKDTHHPALNNPEYFTPKESKDSKNLMDQECTNLLNQIQRLELARRMQDKRLTNVMQLVRQSFPLSVTPFIDHLPIPDRVSVP
jgi:hypothetical protein